jgi:hypothetical protein
MPRAPTVVSCSHSSVTNKAQRQKMHVPFLMTSRNGHVQRCKSRVTTHIHAHINHFFPEIERTLHTLRSSYTSATRRPTLIRVRTACVSTSSSSLLPTLATFVFLHVEGIFLQVVFSHLLYPSVQFTLLRTTVHP